MTQTHRLKRSFTAGELSPWLFHQVDNERHKNGCETLLNAYAKPQGPAWGRSGFRYIDDIQTRMGQAIAGQKTPRLVPFIVDEDAAYMLCFYPYVGGKVRIIFMQDTGLIVDDTATRTTDASDTRVTATGDTRVANGYGSGSDPFIYEIPGTFDLDTFKFAQSGDKLFIVQSNRRPLELRRIQSDVWSLNEAEFIDIPTDWNGVDGWPTLVGFYEQRSVYAGTRARPQTTWLSKSGDFSDFGKSTPIVDSDSLSFTIDSGQQNKLQWLVSTRKLLLGTIGDEWSAGGAGSEPISFTSLRANSQTNEGGETLDPIRIGTAALFLERHGRTVNQFVFSLADDSYSNTDLSILAPHLTLDNSIVRWAHQHEPNGIVWCVRDDGLMLGLTYQQEHNIVGWHRHTSGAGLFKDVACIPGDREDEVWVITERTVNSVDKWYVEKMAKEFTGTTADDGLFLDCHAIYSGAPATTISNLDHLEGFTVDILGDGAPVAPQVVTSGSITLESAVSEAVVGLPYISRVKPTLAEIKIPGEEGTSVGRAQRISEVNISFYRSGGIWLGKDVDEMEEHPFRTPLHPTGAPVPLFTGNKKFPFPEGWDNESHIIIEQRQPLPLCITSITDTIQINDRK